MELSKWQGRFEAVADYLRAPLLLVIGLDARLVSVPLVVTMVVAYVTADNEALRAVFSAPETFTGAAPFMFLLVAVMVLAFGPGAFSLDRVLIEKTETQQSAE